MCEDTSLETGDRIETVRSNFPLIPESLHGHYGILIQVLYIFSVCIYTLFQLCPTVSHLFL